MNDDIVASKKIAVSFIRESSIQYALETLEVKLDERTFIMINPNESISEEVSIGEHEIYIQGWNKKSNSVRVVFEETKDYRFIIKILLSGEIVLKKL